jgi:TM2 domain-containing membrane protein YozV
MSFLHITPGVMVIYFYASKKFIIQKIIAMKTTKIIYWTTTILIFLFDGVVPALTSNSEIARQGISHLLYPDYFRVMLTVFKVTGALVLVLPFLKGRYKEWAYAGFGINFICAATSHWVIDGFGGMAIIPIVAFAILAISYVCYHRINDAREATTTVATTHTSSLKIQGNVVPGLS